MGNSEASFAAVFEREHAEKLYGGGRNVVPAPAIVVNGEIP
jgi:hypothetical protein